MSIAPDPTTVDTEALAERRRQRLAVIAAQTVANGVQIAHRGSGMVASRTQTSIGGHVQYSSPEAIAADYASALAEDTDRTHNRWEQDAYAAAMNAQPEHRHAYAFGYVESIITVTDVPEFECAIRGLKRALDEINGE